MFKFSVVVFDYRRCTFRLAVGMLVLPLLSLMLKESTQRLQFLPLLSLMPKKVTKERHPGSLESPKQIQVFKARAKLAGR